MRNSFPHFLRGQIKSQTEKAWLFSDGIHTEWMPKSQCTWGEETETMSIPDWLMSEKGFGTIPPHIARHAAMLLHKNLQPREILVSSTRREDPTQLTIQVAFPHTDLLLPITEFSNRYIAPAMDRMAKEIAANIGDLPIVTYELGNRRDAIQVEFAGIWLRMCNAMNTLTDQNIARFGIMWEAVGTVREIATPATSTSYQSALARRIRNLDLSGAKEGRS